MAAVLSILKHTSCPENVAFHFLSGRYEPEIFASIRSTFSYLDFNVYRFDSGRVRGKISKSIRRALDQPLNYARIYLPHILPHDVTGVIYLDSDLVLVDDIGRLSGMELDGKVVGAPKYCHANFTKYFTDAFWGDPKLAGAFRGWSGRSCYFNTGVMVLDVERRRAGGYTTRVKRWMMVQKQKRIYHVGSLPPFLLVLAGEMKQSHPGGDNLEGRCRKLHPGLIILLHWSGKGEAMAAAGLPKALQCRQSRGSL